jgi:predicted Zn-dependent peptidase
MMQLSTLDNGLRVASRAMPGFETVAVGLYAEAGSRHEPAHLNGIAHLYEHMVFKGAGARSARELSEAIEDVGGDLNACTEREGTSFSASLLAEHLPLGIELIADMILAPRFDPADLAREKEVVLQELGEARDTPSDIFDDLWMAAWPDQPLGRSILGDEASLAAIGLDDLHAWRRDQYRGGGLILVAAGKVDHAALVALAEARFAGLGEGRIDAAAGAHFAGGVRAGAARADQAHLASAYAAPAALDGDYFAARLFADILGAGASSRLFQAVREERGLAYSVWAALQPYRDAGLFYIYAATARREAAAAAALIGEVAAETAADATPAELARAVAQAKAGLLMSLESSWGQAAYVARQLGLHGRLVEPAEVVRALEAVTLDEVRAAGARMLAGPRASATIGVPAARAA